MRQVFTLLSDPSSSRAATYVSIFMFFVIVLATVSFVLATVPRLNEDDMARQVFNVIEIVSVQIFALDYIVRCVHV